MSLVGHYLEEQCRDLREILATGRDLRRALAAGDPDAASRAVGRRWGILDRMTSREQSAPSLPEAPPSETVSLTEIRDLSDELERLSLAVLTEDRALLAHVGHRRALGQHALRPLAALPN